MRRLIRRGAGVVSGLAIGAVLSLSPLIVNGAPADEPADGETVPDDVLQQVQTDANGIVLTVGVPGSAGVGFKSGPSIDCAWRRSVMSASSGQTNAFANFVDAFGIERVDARGHSFKPDGAGGQLVLFYRSGPDCGDGYVWIASTLSPRDLLPGLLRRVREQLPLPDPNISPPAEFGSLVNVGLWIAVNDPGITVRTLSDGPVWAEGTGTHTRITIDFGNGDVVACEGLGTPIRDTTIKEQGPCGYTFVRTNRPSSSFPVTLTSTYTVTYRLSNGESGVLGTVDRAIEFDYPVKEIQAVGTG